MLQADSASLCTAWVKAIQKTIEDSILDTNSELNRNDQQKHVGSGNASPARSRIAAKEATKMSTTAPPHPPPPADASGRRRQVAECVRAVSGNEKCADCGKQGADWCSINLGITICIECAAIHRCVLFMKCFLDLYIFIAPSALASAKCAHCIWMP